MSREYTYGWPAVIGVGLVFIISQLVWLVPFMRDVEEGAVRYQGEVARRVAAQADFFIEQKLRAVGDEAISPAGLLYEFTREVVVGQEWGGVRIAIQPRGEEAVRVYENKAGDAMLSVGYRAPFAGWLVVAERPLYEAWANKYHAINLAIVLMLVGALFVGILIINFRRIMGIARRETQLAESKSNYISLLAHQLRTPLSGTKWNLRTLIDGDWGPVNAKQKKFLARSYETNEQMITLVRDLLDITRIEEGRYGFTFKKASVADVVLRAISTFRAPARAAGITLTVKKPRGQATRLPLIPLDAEKLQMALENLIDNAIRYNEPEGRVMVSYGAEKGAMMMRVKDTGLGIPRRDQQKLFTKFFRGDNVVKLQVQGFGLGLYIVKNIVEGHGGVIRVESKEHEGSTFTIQIPIK